MGLAFSPLIMKLVFFLVENKFEIRISYCFQGGSRKYETISNDKNSKLRNDKEFSHFRSRLRPLLLFGAFEHLIFGFVCGLRLENSTDFGFRG